MPDTHPPLPPIPPPSELAKLTEAQKALLVVRVRLALEHLPPRERGKRLRELLPFVIEAILATAAALLLACAGPGPERVVVESVGAVLP